MRKIQLSLLLLAVAFMAACTKQQADEQTSPVYNDYSTTSYNDSDHGQGCNGGGTNNTNTSNALIANFDLTLDNGTIFEKQDLNISNKSSNAVSYAWDFGNGDKATGSAPSYKYKIHGNYTVKLTATDDRGNIQTAEKEVIVLCLFGGGSHDQ